MFKNSKNRIIFRFSFFLSGFNNGVNVHKSVSSLPGSETSADLLLNLYFPNSSFTCIVIVRNIWILQEGKEIILAFEESIFKLLKILMKTTAVHINELLFLKIGNIFTNGPKLRIIAIGKGRKKRPIPLLAKPMQYIKQYLTEYHPNPDNPDAFLFYSKSKGIYAPMSAENVNKLLKRYAAIAKRTCKEVPLTLHVH